jgi:amino acid adenylation domain-containing protein
VDTPEIAAGSGRARPGRREGSRAPGIPGARDSAARAGLLRPDAFVSFPDGECDQPIPRRFERQVLRRPDAVAVRTASGDVRYADLNAAANRAAQALLARVGRESRPVALLVDQGYPSIVWTLAILKAGRCYSPLDPRLPELVLSTMIDDLAPCALIVGAGNDAVCGALPKKQVPIIDADDIPGPTSARFASQNLDVAVAPDHPAYVFYTSGSTGAPKGVVDSHRNVLHNVLRYTNSLGFSAGDTLSLVQSPSFSGTVSSLFGALLNGATLAPYDMRREGLPAMSAWIARAKVTAFHAVPSVFRQLADPVDRFPHVRLIRLEGDAASAQDIRHFRAHFRESCTLVNGLGATECGLVRQFFVGCDTGSDALNRVPIGYAVPDMDVRIVDASGRALPPGSIGEIAVESRFLATGYWRKPALTAERFEVVEGELRRYRTRDLGRMDDDGCLTHLGRVDHGIRIAGVLVDIGEIERLLSEVPGVAQAAVHAFDDAGGDRRLCACVVPEGGGRLTAAALRDALSARLTAREVPSAFVFLDALPLTNDLKVDRNALPKPGRGRPSLPNDRVAPANETEHRLAEIWSAALGIDDVGVTDSFFDLGGDSLRAAEIVRRYTERHGDAIDVAALFEHATIRALAGAILSLQ